jgi:hypothetical protein
MIRTGLPRRRVFRMVMARLFLSQATHLGDAREVAHSAEHESRRSRRSARQPAPRELHPPESTELPTPNSIEGRFDTAVWSPPGPAF